MDRLFDKNTTSIIKKLKLNMQHTCNHGNGQCTQHRTEWGNSHLGG